MPKIVLLSRPPYLSYDVGRYGHRLLFCVQIPVLSGISWREHPWYWMENIISESNNWNMNPSLLPLFLVTLGSCSNVGWKSYLRENPTEFHDLPLTWHTKAHVPDWLSGTYVRNGPAQVRHFVRVQLRKTLWKQGMNGLEWNQAYGPTIVM